MTLEALIDLVGMQLGRRQVGPRDRLAEDLGAVSMDLLNLAVAIEDRTGIFIQEEDLAQVRTVDDLHQLVTRLARTDRD